MKMYGTEQRRLMDRGKLGLLELLVCCILLGFGESAFKIIYFLMGPDRDIKSD